MRSNQNERHEDNVNYISLLYQNIHIVYEKVMDFARKVDDDSKVLEFINIKSSLVLMESIQYLSLTVVKC